MLEALHGRVPSPQDCDPRRRAAPEGVVAPAAIQLQGALRRPRANFSDAEISAYEQQGRAAIIESIPTLGIFETAQANAAKVLVPLLTAMGYEEQQVTIAFRKHFDAGDLQDLIRMED